MLARPRNSPQRRGRVRKGPGVHVFRSEPANRHLPGMRSEVQHAHKVREQLCEQAGTKSGESCAVARQESVQCRFTVSL